MIYIIGYKGYIGSNLMRTFPNAAGIGRGDEWPVFDRDDWVINSASYFWHGRELDLERAKDTNYNVPLRLLKYDCNIIQLTSTAAETHAEDPVWQLKKAGDDLLISKAHMLVLPTVYGGINQHPHMFMTALLQYIHHNKMFKLETPDAMRDFVHIVNVKARIHSIIDGKYRAIRKPHRITSGQEISMLTMFRIASDLGYEASCNKALTVVTK